MVGLQPRKVGSGGSDKKGILSRTTPPLSRTNTLNWIRQAVGGGGRVHTTKERLGTTDRRYDCWQGRFEEGGKNWNGQAARGEGKEQNRQGHVYHARSNKKAREVQQHSLFYSQFQSNIRGGLVDTGVDQPNNRGNATRPTSGCLEHKKNNLPG